MEKRRVLLLCAQPLLGEGLETILRKLEDVELIGPWAPTAQVLAHLSSQTPDVVLVAAEAEHEEMAALTTQILKQFPDLPIVQIGLQENAVRLYTSQTLPARSADLIEAIRSLPIRQHQEKADNL